MKAPKNYYNYSEIFIEPYMGHFGGRCSTIVQGHLKNVYGTFLKRCSPVVPENSKRFVLERF